MERSCLRAVLWRQTCVLVRISAWILEGVMSREKGGMLLGAGDVVGRFFLFFLEGIVVQTSSSSAMMVGIQL